MIEQNKNCHEYCPYRKQCRYAKGENGINPEDCAMYWKIDDIMNETDDIREEQRRSRGDYEDEFD